MAVISAVNESGAIVGSGTKSTKLIRPAMWIDLNFDNSGSIENSKIANEVQVEVSPDKPEATSGFSEFLQGLELDDEPQ